MAGICPVLFAGISVFGSLRPSSSALGPLSGLTSSFEPDEALHVVDQIGHAGLGSDAS